jgi:hypothetical protein
MRVKEKQVLVATGHFVSFVLFPALRVNVLYLADLINPNIFNTIIGYSNRLNK